MEVGVLMLNYGRWSVRELGAGRESATRQVCSQVMVRGTLFRKDRCDGRQGQHRKGEVWVRARRVGGSVT